jgi:hypothetical protein
MPASLPLRVRRLEPGDDPSFVKTAPAPCKTHTSWEKGECKRRSSRNALSVVTRFAPMPRSGIYAMIRRSGYTQMRRSSLPAWRLPHPDWNPLRSPLESRPCRLLSGTLRLDWRTTICRLLPAWDAVPGTWFVSETESASLTTVGRTTGAGSVIALLRRTCEAGSAYASS